MKYLDTQQAAEYLGYKTRGGIRHLGAWLARRISSRRTSFPRTIAKEIKMESPQPATATPADITTAIEYAQKAHPEAEIRVRRGRVLAIEGGDQLAAVEIGERDDLRLSKAECVFERLRGFE